MVNCWNNWEEEEIEEIYGEALTADGFEDALLGFGHQFRHSVAVYDRDKCIEILMKRDGMSREDAEEFFDFNVIGAWVGEHTPVFLELKKEKNNDDNTT